jgi:hypothetical protein
MFKPLNLNPTRQSDQPRLPIRKLFRWHPDLPNTLELHFDWSSLECYLSCIRSAYFKLVRSRTSAPSSALVFGAAMHAALEIYYKLRSKHEPMEVLGLCQKAIDNTYEEYPGLQLFGDYRTPSFCWDSFLAYVAEYKNDGLKPVLKDDKPLVEFSFALELGQTEIDASVFAEHGYGMLTSDASKEQQASGLLTVKIIWTGICDMLAERDGEVWLVDHKTTSILSNDFFESFNIAMQPVGYVNAVRKAYPELKIAGFLVNVLACRRPTKTGKSFEPHRSTYRYEQWQTDEWNTDVLTLIEDFLHSLTTNEWPKQTTWCVGKYGKCPYFDVCSLPPKQRIMFLNTDQYADNTWKPVGH